MRLLGAEIESIIANSLGVGVDSVSLTDSGVEAIVLLGEKVTNLGVSTEGYQKDAVPTSPKISYTEVHKSEAEPWVLCKQCNKSNRLTYDGKEPKYCSNCGKKFDYSREV